MYRQSPASDHRGMWTVLNHDWTIYLTFFAIQIATGLGYLLATAAWSKGILHTAVGVWSDASPVIITSAGISLVLVEIGGWMWRCPGRHFERKRAEQERLIGIGIEIGRRERTGGSYGLGA